MKKNSQCLGMFIVMMLFASNTHAAREWAFTDVTIKDVTFGNLAGNSFITVVFNEDILFPTCLATHEANLVSYWNGGTNDFMFGLQSSALAAQAQGLKVDILVETSNCSTHGDVINQKPDGSPAASGRGVELQGIKVKLD